MKPFVPLCLAFLPVLAACETTRSPTPAELFAGQAIISVHAATEPPPPESYHRQMLETPLDVTDMSTGKKRMHKRERQTKSSCEFF
jgi:hypothetical protein